MLVAPVDQPEEFLMIDSNSRTALPIVSAFSTVGDKVFMQQISGPRVYRIQDVWGDDLVELPIIPPEAVLTLPVSSAVKKSWPRRFLIWLFGPLLIESTTVGEQLSGKASASGTSLDRTAGQRKRSALPSPML